MGTVRSLWIVPMCTGKVGDESSSILRVRFHIVGLNAVIVDWPIHCNVADIPNIRVGIKLLKDGLGTIVLQQCLCY